MNTDKVFCNSCKVNRDIVLFKEGCKACGLCRNKSNRYSENHRERLLVERKEYRERNADKIKAYRLLTVRCEVCDCDIKRNAQAEHRKTKRHQHNLNKQAENRIEQQKEPKGLATLYAIMNG